MVTIPISNLDSLAFFSLQALLDNVTYTLQFRWNDRAAGWFMDVLNEAGDTVYVAGIRLVGGAALSGNITGRPYPGFFIAFDTSESGKDAGFDDLGKLVVLLYADSNDVAALVAGTI